MTHNRRMKSWARSSGARDGKAEIPNDRWQSDSVPFFLETLATYQKLAQDKILKTRDKLNKRVNQILSRVTESEILRRSLNMKEMQIQNRELRIASLQNSIDGYDEEQPIGRFARTQAIPSIVHYPALLVLAAGEFFVTKEAIINLLGGSRDEAFTVAVAVALLTILGAHLLGILLKLRLDRQRPQEGWVRYIAWGLGISLIVTIAFLAILRAGLTFKGGASSLQNIIDDSSLRKAYLALFFFTVQSTFLIVGSVMSFLHHSPVAQEMHGEKRKLYADKWKLRRIQRKLAKLDSDLTLSKEVVESEIEEVKADIRLLGAQYVATCATYKTANIHARRDELNASHQSMQEPEFTFNPNQFDDILNLAEENLAK